MENHNKEARKTYFERRQRWKEEKTEKSQREKEEKAEKNQREKEEKAEKSQRRSVQTTQVKCQNNNDAASSTTIVNFVEKMTSSQFGSWKQVLTDCYRYNWYKYGFEFVRKRERENEQRCGFIRHPTLKNEAVGEGDI